MVPPTSPLFSTRPARISPLTMALSPMMSVSVDEISPLKRPFSMTVPLNVYRPSISEPSSMKAERALRPDLGLVADDERVRGRDLPLEASVQHDRPAERVPALDLRAFVNEGRKSLAARSWPCRR